MEEKIRKIGYIFDFSLVFYDLSEEEKLEVLRGYSEKFVILFGLLKMVKGVILRVCKNLWICCDCYNVIKLVFKVVDREIVVRDNKWFYYFKNGCCLCGEYW